jgi:hypothetical protein
MSDSPLDLTQPFIPEEGTELVAVPNKDGSTRIALRAKEGGRFVKRQPAMPDGKEVTRAMRKALAKLEADPTTGRLTKNSRNAVMRMMENMVRIATNTSEDAKAMSAAVQAYKEVMARAYGVPGKTDEDREDLKTAGVKIVLIPSPELMHDKTIEIGERLKQPTQPKFIEGEVISTNEQKDSDAT